MSASAQGRTRLMLSSCGWSKIKRFRPPALVSSDGNAAQIDPFEALAQTIGAQKCGEVQRVVDTVKQSSLVWSR